jgi:hypothetical protein
MKTTTRIAPVILQCLTASALADTFAATLLIVLSLFYIHPPAAGAVEPVQTWLHTYDGRSINNGYNAIKGSASDSAGNFYVCGGSNVGTAATPDAAFSVVKYAPDGTQIWVATYSPSGIQRGGPSAMTVDESGNVYVTGYIETTYPGKCVTVKWDNTGAFQWGTDYAGSGRYPSGGAGVAVDGAGAVYVAASDSAHLDTIKYSSSGVQQWVKSYTAPRGYGHIAAIAADADGNVVMVGDIDNSSVSYSTQSDFFTVKYDTNGTQQWLKTQDFPIGNVYSYDQARCVTLGGDGAVYVGGTGRNGADAIVKYDSAGNEVWAKTKVISSSSNTDTINEIVIDGAGNVICFGQIGLDMGIIKYDAAGTEIWTKRYKRQDGGYGGASGGTVDGAGNVYVAGYSRTTGYNTGAALACYTADGTFQWAKVWTPPGVSDYDASFGDVFVDASGNVSVGGGFADYTNSIDNLLAIKYTPPPPPTTTTTAATEVTATSAKLNGSVNPNGNAATAYFEYGTSGSYGAQTASQSLPADNATVDLSATITGLLPETTYHFRVAASGLSAAQGSDLTFTTPVAPPVATGPADNITGTSAQLHGSATPAAGGTVTVRFEYGPTNAYGMQSPERVLTGPVGIPVGVSVTIAGLTRSASYHFRLIVVGGAAGDDATFNTLANAAPVAVNDNARLRGMTKTAISVLANDSDQEGDPLTVTAVTQGAVGKVEFKNDIVSYTPGKTFAGADTFTYTIDDGMGGTALGTVEVSNPFLFIVGNYQAALLDGISGLPNGSVKAKLTSGGSVTGSVVFGGKSYALNGIVDFARHFAQTIPRKGLPSLLVTVDFQSTGFGRATIAVSDGIAALSGDAAAQAKQPPAGVSPGAYTLTLPGNGDGVSGPLGIGYATANVTLKGAVKLAGKLPDGTAFTAGGQLESDGHFGFLLPLYPKPKGYVYGALDFASNTISGSVTVHKPSQDKPGKQIYPTGFDDVLAAEGNYFADPGKGMSALDGLDTAAAYLFTAQFNGAGTPFTSGCAIQPSDKVTADPPTTILKIDRKTGLVTGSFLDPDTGAKRSLSGVVNQPATTASGLFLDAVSSWPFTLEPN